MTIAIRLSEELELELAETAKKMKRSKSFLVREAVIHYLEDINDYYAGIEALEKTKQSLRVFYRLAEKPKPTLKHFLKQIS